MPCHQATLATCFHERPCIRAIQTCPTWSDHSLAHTFHLCRAADASSNFFPNHGSSQAALGSLPKENVIQQTPGMSEARCCCGAGGRLGDVDIFQVFSNCSFCRIPLPGHISACTCVSHGLAQLRQLIVKYVLPSPICNSFDKKITGWIRKPREARRGCQLWDPRERLERCWSDVRDGVPGAACPRLAPCVANPIRAAHGSRVPSGLSNPIKP